MIYKMKLNNEPFESIKCGLKTIEMRLNDEKRKLIKVGDIIEFTNRNTLQALNVRVINLYNYSSFDELYDHFDKIDLGYKKEDIASPKDMELYYSKEEQAKYGVLGIEITLIV